MTFCTNFHNAVGLSDKAGVAVEHKLLMFCLWLMVCVDRLDVTQLACSEHICRRVLQLQKAIRRSPKSPDFSGSEPYLRHVADPSLGAATPKFDEFVSGVLKSEGAWMKQSRLAKEEQEAQDKRRNKKKKDDD